MCSCADEYSFYHDSSPGRFEAYALSRQHYRHARPLFLATLTTGSPRAPFVAAGGARKRAYRGKFRVPNHTENAREETPDGLREDAGGSRRLMESLHIALLRAGALLESTARQLPVNGQRRDRLGVVR